MQNRDIEYNFFPLDIYDDISRLVFQSFTANGKPVDNNYYESEWSVIKSHSEIVLEVVEQRVDYIPNSLFENKVELNSTVKIKFLSNEKELNVKLVDYQTNGAEIINGVQIVNITKPLAVSIKGRRIGDRVTIGDTKSKVEIIDIL